MPSINNRLAKYLSFRVRVTLKDSGVFIGTFRAFDRYMNIILAECDEFRQIKGREEKRELGLVFLRGECVISLSVDRSPPPENPPRLPPLPVMGYDVGPGIPASVIEMPVLAQNMVTDVGESYQQATASRSRGVLDSFMDMPILPQNVSDGEPFQQATASRGLGRLGRFSEMPILAQNISTYVAEPFQQATASRGRERLGSFIEIPVLAQNIATDVGEPFQQATTSIGHGQFIAPPQLFQGLPPLGLPVLGLAPTLDHLPNISFGRSRRLLLSGRGRMSGSPPGSPRYS